MIALLPPLSLTLDYMPKNAAPLQCLVPDFMRVIKRVKSGLSDLYNYLYDRGGLNPFGVRAVIINHIISRRSCALWK